MRLINDDRVELYGKEKITYRSLVRQIVSDKLIYVALPTHRSVVMQVDVKDEVYLTFFRERGRYVVRTVVKEIIELDGNPEQVLLELLSPPELRQQREFFRLPVRLKTVVYKIVLRGEGDEPESHDEVHDEAEVIEFETAETKDLSVAGVGIESSREYHKGDKFQLRIYLAFSEDDVRQVLTYVDVMRSELNTHTNKYKVGMRFFGLSSETTNELSKFVTKAQQRQIVRKRTI
jgi:hypothetical protein